MKQLETKLQSHLRTSIRYSIATARIADEYNQRISLSTGMSKKEVNMQFILDTGTQSSLAGFGQMYEDFLQSNMIGDFTGKGQKAVTIDKEHFDVAPIRKFTFKNTFDDKHSKYWESKKISLLV